MSCQIFSDKPESATYQTSGLRSTTLSWTGWLPRVQLYSSRESLHCVQSMLRPTAKYRAEWVLTAQLNADCVVRSHSFVTYGCVQRKSDIYMRPHYLGKYQSCMFSNVGFIVHCTRTRSLKTVIRQRHCGASASPAPPCKAGLLRSVCIYIIGNSESMHTSPQICIHF